MRNQKTEKEKGESLRNPERKEQLLRIVVAALFVALVYVTTMLAIPLPRGNLNFGEACVLLSGLTVGPFGAVAAAIGAALADASSGYMIYVPATLIIKFLTAGCVCLLYRFFGKPGRPAGSEDGSAGKARIVAAAAFCIPAECIMIGGYFLYEWILSESLAVAVTTLPGNLVQALAGVLVAVLLYALIPSKWRNRFTK